MTVHNSVSHVTPGGRLFRYVLIPAAVLLCITIFYNIDQQPSRIPSFDVPAATPYPGASTHIQSDYVTLNSSGDSNSNRDGVSTVATGIQPPTEACEGRYIYVYDLPSRFNKDILDDCSILCTWSDMTDFMSNGGLGPNLGTSRGDVFSGFGGSWYGTDQFALDLIFYRRMKHYACLTNDSSKASAIYVPFFAGLDIGRYLLGYNTSVRDAASLDLMVWLRSRPEWSLMYGRDHFLVAGRIWSDFRRYSDSDCDWGNKLLRLPEAMNMTILVLESGPWNGTDISIPYPTYFHPSNEGEVLSWQNRLRKPERPWLFSFAGAPRPHQAESIRGRIFEQCQGSRRCRLLDCGTKPHDCHSPPSVIETFRSSSFCLQPPGDSFTRRSMFDSMVAGCVPVFFHPGSAYEQYRWHLPRNGSAYSVFIPEEEVREGKVNIEERLAKIPESKVRAMRDEVIRMIPRLVYAEPTGAKDTRMTKDAFEAALEGVIDRVRRLRGRSLDNSMHV